MTKSPSIVVNTLLALAVAGSMAAFFVQPAAAQTATNLNCKGCIKSKQVKNGKLKGKDLKDSTVTGSKIAPNAVDGSKISDGTVGSADLGGDSVTSVKILDGTVQGADVAGESVSAGNLSNEPGVEFDNNDNLNFSVTTTAAVVRTLVVTAPTSGFVTCMASGHADYDNNVDEEFQLGWDSVGGTTNPPDSNRVRLLPVAASADPRIGITALRTFTVAAGTQSFFLKARCSSCAVGDLDFGYHASACMFFPTQY